MAPRAVTLTIIDPDGTPHGLTVQAGLSLLEIAQQHGFEVEGTCEGSMACATCHMIVDPAWAPRLPEMSEAEQDMLDLADGVCATSRLGCQVVVTAALDGLVVRLPKS